jgi:hypothetical protein
VDVRIEYPGEHDLAARIQGFLGCTGQVLPDGDNLTSGNRYVGHHRPDAGDDQRAVANHQVELAGAAADCHCQFR